MPPHREARSQGWPEVAPGVPGAPGLQFTVGGGQQYPKEATQQHSGPSAGPPAFPGAGALWDSPLVTYVPSRLSPDWAVLEPSVLCS